jgi:hypothetical protein
MTSSTEAKTPPGCSLLLGTLRHAFHTLGTCRGTTERLWKRQSWNQRRVMEVAQRFLNKPCDPADLIPGYRTGLFRCRGIDEAVARRNFRPVLEGKLTNTDSLPVPALLEDAA